MDKPLKFIADEHAANYMLSLAEDTDAKLRHAEKTCRGNAIGSFILAAFILVLSYFSDNAIAKSGFLVSLIFVAVGAALMNESRNRANDRRDLRASLRFLTRNFDLSEQTRAEINSER